MAIDISKYKVIYKEKVWRALALMNIEFGEDVKFDEIVKKPKFIEILVINEDGCIEIIRDEARMFQFLPIIGGKDAGSI